MRQGSKPKVAQTLQTVRRDLAKADAGKIAQVVATIDGLSSRGAADTLLAPLRSRLARLNLPRPLTLGRLLFTPVDPVRVSGAAWRREAPGVPQTVLGPLAISVRFALGADAQKLDAQLAGHLVSDEDVMLSEGRWLWPRAAEILHDAAPSEHWNRQTGLSLADHTVLRRAVSLVLAQAAWLHGRPEASEERLADAATRFQAAKLHDHALATAIAALLIRLPRADAALDLIEGLVETTARPAIHRAREAAVGFVLDRVRTGTRTRAGLAQATAELQRDVALLQDLEDRWKLHPSGRVRIHQARRALDEECRTRFQAALEGELAPPEALDPSVAAATIAAMEGAARALSRFGQVARRIGDSAFYDRALRAAAVRLTGPDGAKLGASDRARLLELLLGSEAAAAILAPRPPGDDSGGSNSSRNYAPR